MFLFFYILLIVNESDGSSNNDCGPLGFNAKDLLGPSYWFLDLNTTCPPIPPPTTSFVPPKQMNSSCRIYFNLCQNMNYQCYGTLCVNYLETVDFVTRLGMKGGHPFVEGDNGFTATYTGDKLPCKGGLKASKTSFTFQCSHTNESKWSRNVADAHGGSKAPDPISVHFDENLCQYTMIFNYTGACYTVPSGDSKAKDISTGSLILILFFPGVALYFILGILMNRARGMEGKEMIPHRKFWTQLPELIMDGFAFSMATLTCSKDDKYMKDYEPVEET